MGDYLQHFGYFVLKLMCAVGLHSDYKHDGEWVGQCAFCRYGHPADSDSTFPKSKAANAPSPEVPHG